MAISTEREPVPKGLEERGGDVSALTIEQKEVVTPIPSQFKAQVMDDSGNPLIQTPPASVITVSVPTEDSQLLAWSKGSTDESLTWFGVFWQRVIKRALHFGWRVVGGVKSEV